MQKIIQQIILFPAIFLVSFCFAWMPMLGWNLGIVVIFPELPRIDYMTAFWLSVLLGYLTTKIVPMK